MRSPPRASTRQQVAGGVLHRVHDRVVAQVRPAVVHVQDGHVDRARSRPAARRRRRDLDAHVVGASGSARVGQSVTQYVLAVGPACSGRRWAMWRGESTSPFGSRPPAGRRPRAGRRSPRTPRSGGRRRCRPTRAQARRKSHLLAACPGRPPRRRRSPASRGPARAWAPRALSPKSIIFPSSPRLSARNLFSIRIARCVARGCRGCSRTGGRAWPPGPARARRWRSSRPRGRGCRRCGTRGS